MDIKRVFNFKNGKAITVFDSKFEYMFDIPKYSKLYDRYFEMVYSNPMEEPYLIEYGEFDIGKYKLKPKDIEDINMPVLKCDCGGVITRTMCSKWCSTKQYD